MLRVKNIPILLFVFFVQGASSSVFADGCEVVSYDVSEVKDKHISCSGKVSYTEHQCVDFTIRSLSSVGHQIKDFKIKAVYEDRTYEKRKMMSANSDSDNVLVGAGEKYSGRACFRIMPRIAQVECSIK